jgi:hypothetical protein
MDFRGELAYYFVALAYLPKRDCIAAVGRRLGVLDDSKRNNVSGVTGILYVSERLDNRIIRTSRATNAIIADALAGRKHRRREAPQSTSAICLSSSISRRCRSISLCCSASSSSICLW